MTVFLAFSGCVAACWWVFRAGPTYRVPDDHQQQIARERALLREWGGRRRLTQAQKREFVTKLLELHGRQAPAEPEEFQ